MTVNFPHFFVVVVAAVVIFMRKVISKFSLWTFTEYVMHKRKKEQLNQNAKWDNVNTVDVYINICSRNGKISHELWMDIQNDNFYLEKYYLMYILSHKYLLSAIQATLIKYKFHIINA